MYITLRLSQQQAKALWKRIVGDALTDQEGNIVTQVGENLFSAGFEPDDEGEEDTDERH